MFVVLSLFITTPSEPCKLKTPFILDAFVFSQLIVYLKFQFISLYDIEYHDSECPNRHILQKNTCSGTLLVGYIQLPSPPTSATSSSTTLLGSRFGFLRDSSSQPRLAQVISLHSMLHKCSESTQVNYHLIHSWAIREGSYIHF